MRKNERREPLEGSKVAEGGQGHSLDCLVYEDFAGRCHVLPVAVAHRVADLLEKVIVEVVLEAPQVDKPWDEEANISRR